MKFLSFVFYLLLLTLLACNKDTDLKKSVFIPDGEFADLPSYSEWGYNTFGAYYDRRPFISNYRDVPVKVTSTVNETVFTFKGQLDQYSGNAMSLIIKLSDLKINSYADLVSLHQSSKDLAGSGVQVLVVINTVQYAAKVLNGVLEFKRAQNLLVDKKQTEVILSGVFDFQGIIDGLPVTVSEGRFDVGVGKDNFFVLD